MSLAVRSPPTDVVTLGNPESTAPFESSRSMCIDVGGVSERGAAHDADLATGERGEPSRRRRSPPAAWPRRPRPNRDTTARRSCSDARESCRRRRVTNMTSAPTRSTATSSRRHRVSVAGSSTDQLTVVGDLLRREHDSCLDAGRRRRRGLADIDHLCRVWDVRQARRCSPSASSPPEGSTCRSSACVGADVFDTVGVELQEPTVGRDADLKTIETVIDAIRRDRRAG